MFYYLTSVVVTSLFAYFSVGDENKLLFWGIVIGAAVFSLVLVWSLFKIIRYIITMHQIRHSFAPSIKVIDVTSEYNVKENDTYEMRKTIKLKSLRDGLEKFEFRFLLWGAETTIFGETEGITKATIEKAKNGPYDLAILEFEKLEKDEIKHLSFELIAQGKGIRPFYTEIIRFPITGMLNIKVCFQKVDKPQSCLYQIFPTDTSHFAIYNDVISISSHKATAEKRIKEPKFRHKYIFSW